MNLRRSTRMAPRAGPERRRFLVCQPLVGMLTALSLSSILALLGMPMVYETLVRAEMRVALARVQPILRDIRHHYQVTGDVPKSNAEAGLNAPASFASDPVVSIEVAEAPSKGSVIVRLNLEVLGSENRLILTPAPMGSRLRWSCEQSAIPPRFLPARCADL